MEYDYWSFGVAPLLLFVTCISIIVLRTVRNRKIQLLDWSLMFIALVYGLLAPPVLNAIMRGPVEVAGSHFIERRIGDSFTLHTLAVLVAVIGLLIGWTVKPHRRGDQSRIQEGSDRARLAKWLWIMAGVAVAAQYLFTIDYGGLLGVFDYSVVLRAGAFDESGRSRFSALAPLAGFSMIACYGFFGLLQQRAARTRSALIGFLVTFVFSLYVLFSLQGRVGLVVFVASLTLGAILLRTRARLMILFGLPVAVIAGAAGLRFASEILKRGSSESDLQFITEQVSFIYTGFWAWADDPSISFRYFYDLLVAPLFLLPSSLTSTWFSRVGDVHTAQILGYPKGAGGVTGAMPLDLVTFGYLQSGLIGVLVCATIFGAGLKALQQTVDDIPIAGVRAVFEAHVSLKIAGFGLLYAEPENLIRGNLPLLIVLVAIWLLRMRSRRGGDRLAARPDRLRGVGRRNRRRRGIVSTAPMRAEDPAS